MRKRTGESLRHEQAALVKTIGDRLRQARELCNLSQLEAAKRLGYANSTKLSKIERATDTNSIPIWLIARAAKVYEVSVDYLFGFSTDWETSARAKQERETSAWLFDAWDAQRRKDMTMLRKLNDRLMQIAASVQATFESAGKVETSLARFVELNPEFQDMRGSATLAAAVRMNVEEAAAYRAKLQRFKTECRLASATMPQLNLFSSEEGEA